MSSEFALLCVLYNLLTVMSSFIFYFGTTFFNDLGTISNPFLISLITTLVNVCSTPVSFWTIERFGRRPLLIYGALGMFVCEFIVGIIGVAKPGDTTVVKAQISFICVYVFFFASTWGPGAWVSIGEIFPLPIRARGVGLSTASNWLWNCIIAVITPYLVGTDQAVSVFGKTILLEADIFLEPRFKSLFPLGFNLYALLYLRLSLCMGDQGPHIGTG